VHRQAPEALLKAARFFAAGTANQNASVLPLKKRAQVAIATAVLAAWCPVGLWRLIFDRRLDRAARH
jgi:hypothetical protein